MKTSNYIIYLRVPETDDYYLVHGYSGSVDKVSGEVVKYLLDRVDPDHTWHIKDQEKVRESLADKTLGDISSESVELLRKRGYLTPMTTAEEQLYVERLAGFIHKKNVESRSPSFMIVPIYECNLRCPYCFEADTRVQLGKLAILKSVMLDGMVDAAFKSMEMITNARFGEGGASRQTGKSITLYGGEPLMKETLPIVEYIVRKGLDKGYGFGAITNGVDLQDFTHLLGQGKIGFLQVTLDGPRDIHDRKRIGPRHKDGTYDKILTNVKAVLESTDVRISIRYHVDQNNITRTDDVLNDLESRGLFKYKNFGIYSYPIHDFHHGFDKPVYPMMSTCEVQESLDKTLEGVSTKDKLARPNEAIPTKLKTYLESQLAGMYKSVEPCAATTGMYIFDPLGRIYTCWDTVGIAGKEVGTYSAEGPVLNSQAEMWLQRSPQHIEECKNCKYVLFHFGGCASMPLSVKGTIYSPSCYEFQDNFIYVGQKFFKQGIDHIVNKKQSPTQVQAEPAVSLAG